MTLVKLPRKSNSLKALNPNFTYLRANSSVAVYVSTGFLILLSFLFNPIHLQFKSSNPFHRSPQCTTNPNVSDFS